MRPLIPGPDLIAQLLRFGVAGGAIAAASVLVYMIAAGPIGCAPLLANLLSYLFYLAIGFRIHAGWSFGGVARGRGVALRYLAVSLGAFALNSLWVWLLTVRAHAPAWTPVVPMLTLTPMFSFCASRLWVFTRGTDAAAERAGLR